MIRSQNVPILGMACSSYVGEKLTGNRSPSVISSQATGNTTPYYALGDDTDNPERHFSILDNVISRALKRSDLPIDEIKNIGLFLGSSSYDLRSSELAFLQQLEEKAHDPVSVKYTGSSRLSDWVANRFNISSDAFNINTACTSSANALLLAQQMLNHGVFRHALVIGIELFNETTLGGFSGLQLLATDRLSPFDKQRDGLLLGEGCAAVVLGSDECNSPFWLAGGGTSFDPHSITAANQDGSSIAEAILSALSNTGLIQSDIKAIKAQGSGSHTNDLAESRGLQTAFRTINPAIFNGRHSKVGDVPDWRGVDSRDAAAKPPPYMDAQVSREAGSRKRPRMDSRRPHQPGTSPTHTDIVNDSVSKIPPLTAIKPYIGHTLGACGVLELVLFCHALADGFIPRTPNFSTPDPDLSITPNTLEQKAEAGSYLLNYFGFGGNNTVLVLEKRL